jgi:hypothetical protein
MKTTSISCVSPPTADAGGGGEAAAADSAGTESGREVGGFAGEQDTEGGSWAGAEVLGELIAECASTIVRNLDDSLVGTLNLNFGNRHSNFHTVRDAVERLERFERHIAIESKFSAGGNVAFSPKEAKNLPNSRGLKHFHLTLAQNSKERGTLLRKSRDRRHGDTFCLWGFIFCLLDRSALFPCCLSV